MKRSDNSLHANNSLKNTTICIVSVTIYIFSLISFLKTYAAIEWNIYGYSYRELVFSDFVMLIGFIFATAMTIPKRVYLPSHLALVIIYIFVVVPATVIFVSLYNEDEYQYYWISIVITICFAITCTLLSASRPDNSKSRELPSVLPAILVIFSIILILFLVYTFGSIMSFSNFDNIYEQRSKGAASNLIEGYAQSYLQYVFATGILAIGLYSRNIFLVVFSIFCSLICYMITAEKAGLFYPVLIILLFSGMRSQNEIWKSTYIFILLFSAIMYFSSLLYQVSDIAEFISWYFGMRSVFFPGAFIAYYFDYFSNGSFTNFSHIRGLNMIISTPAEFASDPRWPSIGLIFGEEYFKRSQMNASANFIASDGVASLGYIGILISFIIFGLFIKCMDYLSKGISPDLSLCLLVAIFLTLTNGSIFTVLTSFGGIFWILVFKYVFTSNPDGLRRMVTARSWI